MVRWYYQSIFDELEDMRKYMESLSRQMYETNPIALLPGPDEHGTKMLPARGAGLRVDVADADKEVVVTADLIPGISKKDITLSLINPQALEISCERREENKKEKEGYFIQELKFGSLTRVILLPRPVTEEGSTASFKNGVLEIHLRKSEKERKGKISID
jgi:HSP20 family protein